jgi:hypothetical protein
VRTTFVIIRRPLMQQTAQVVSGQRDHEVQILPPQRADELLTEGIRQGTLRRRFQDPQSEMAHTLVKRLGIDAVLVMNQEAVAKVRRHRVTQLVEGPRQSDMGRRIDVQYPVWGDVRMGLPTQKTCSTASPLCMISSSSPFLLSGGSSVSACPYHSAEGCTPRQNRYWWRISAKSQYLRYG